jgi:hypothetical protein
MHTSIMVGPLRRLALLLAISAVTGTCALADVSMKLMNAGASYVMGGVYTSPYGVSINDGAPTMLICDDFTTDINLGQTWTAIVTTLDELQAGTNPSGTPKFTDVAKYATAALLAAQLMALPNLASAAAGELSYALWNIFDPGLLGNPQHNPYGSLTPTQLNAALGYYNAAVAAVAAITSNGNVDLSKLTFNGQLIKLTIYTPKPLTASQEFLKVTLVPMVEAALLSMLAVDLLAGVALIVGFGRRKPRTAA